MKKLLQLILPVTGKTGILKYLFLGTVTGLCGFLFINAMTRVIGIMMADNFTFIRKEYLIAFASIILVYVWARRTLALTSMNLSLRITWHLRKQILALVLNANYRQVASRVPRIQTAILNDVNALTNASLSAIDFCIAVIMAFSCFIYLATISLVLFGITITAAGAGVAIYYVSARKNMKNLEKARKLENLFQTNLNAMLHGFKEIYMEPRKGSFFYDQKICTNANESFRHSVWAISGFINNQMIGQVLFYLLVSSVLLIFSVVLHIPPPRVVSFVLTLLFLQGSLETIMVQLTTLARARVAADQLLGLKAELEALASRKQPPVWHHFGEPFQQLTVRDLTFEYTPEGEGAAFRIGSLNLDIGKGETIFIYGGNGSGKTTFIFTLLGLCLPDAGQIAVNGVPVTEDNYEAYKTQFAVIFSNFYLFNEILSTEEPDPEKWQYYLHLFELEGKVELKDNRLTTTELSAGQRKRLALIVALMEGKPLLILDEWAADQDPYFRKKFYTVILPLLNREGFTILAITHDDRYYHCANKLYKMQEGKIIEEDLQLYNYLVPDEKNLS
ncbi:cyclic peptide export ABC transporter [Chitinophaga sp. Mgbs1]|uniref:Cyclic peptide export ABC transporter n=1 Tax=Chitinophaga solisilvae TaxID=1233460 RepID=A0A9Q5DA80_9BACT|nr:cyclic peptide export ABC transporter [Chitinophaga solisilvae]